MTTVTVKKTGFYYLKTTQTDIAITAAPGVTVTITPPIGYNIAGFSLFNLYGGQTVNLTLSATSKTWLTGQIVPFHNQLQGLNIGDFQHLTMAQLKALIALLNLKVTTFSN